MESDKIVTPKGILTKEEIRNLSAEQYAAYFSGDKNNQNNDILKNEKDENAETAGLSESDKECCGQKDEAGQTDGYEQN